MLAGLVGLDVGGESLATNAAGRSAIGIQGIDTALRGTDILVSAVGTLAQRKRLPFGVNKSVDSAVKYLLHHYYNTHFNL